MRDSLPTNDAQPSMAYGKESDAAPGGRLMRNPPGKRFKPGGGPEEPVTEYIEDDGQVRVLVMLPGISETKIRIHLENHSLVISACDGGKEYRKEITLPWTAQIVRRKFQHNVLELNLQKTDS